MVLRGATKQSLGQTVLSQNSLGGTAGQVSPPCRVISAEAKSQRNIPSTKYRIAGVLEVVGGANHYAEVREGVLVLHTEACPTSQAQWKVPLRGLSLLQAKPLGLAFALASPTESSPLTFQVGTEYEYERWVKCLAVELMRQTPLDRVRFLDILGITGSLRRSRSAECVSSRDNPQTKNGVEYTSVDCPPDEHDCEERLGRIQELGLDLSKTKECYGYEDDQTRSGKEYFKNGNDCMDDGTNCCKVDSKCLNSCTLGMDCVNATPPPPDLTSPPGPPSSHLVYRKRSQLLPDVVRDLPPCSRRSRSRKKELRVTKIRGQSLEPVSIMYDQAQPQVTELLLKCQRSDVYVPVREKRLLFESLWRRESQVVARSQSLHDLSQPEPLVHPVARYTDDNKTRHPLADVGVSLENMVEGEVNRQRRHLQISDKLSHYTSPYGNAQRR